MSSYFATGFKATSKEHGTAAFSLPPEPRELAGVHPYAVANVSSNLTEGALPKLHCLVFVTSKEQVDSRHSTVDVCWLLHGPGLCNDRLPSARRGCGCE